MTHLQPHQNTKLGVFGTGSSSNPNFSDLEIASGIDHLRPYYKMASHGVHANPKGIFFQLGLIAESNFLLSGVSNAGLADPGNCAAISLAQASSALVNLESTLDNIVTLQLMHQLTGEIGNAFAKVHAELEREK